MKARWPVSLSCEVLGVSVSGYFEHQRRRREKRPTQAGSGRLSDEAMERAVGALKVCSDKLRRRNVHLARSVATEACRRASNGAQFIDRVRSQHLVELGR